VDIAQEAGFREPEQKKTKEDENQKRINKKMAVDSYAECYPGYAQLPMFLFSSCSHLCLFQHDGVR
jgi:hypothetical protein